MTIHFPDIYYNFRKVKYRRTQQYSKTAQSNQIPFEIICYPHFSGVQNEWDPMRVSRVAPLLDANKEIVGTINPWEGPHCENGILFCFS